MAHRFLVSVDFDGVLSSYSSGWQGADVINDLPVDGAIEWLENLVNDARFDVCIYSSRNHQEGGPAAMCDWLLNNGLQLETLRKINFPLVKPSTHISIDDRANCFNGFFPALDWIADFKPWNKR